jgi:hypothetical protein
VVGYPGDRVSIRAALLGAALLVAPAVALLGLAHIQQGRQPRDEQVEESSSSP